MAKRHGPHDFDEEGGIAEALIDAIREGAITKRVSKKRATRFYDRIRNKIKDYIAHRGAKLGTAADLLLFAPDVFMLLFRLMRDARVSATNKVLVGTGIAYFVLPIDILPEAIIGPMGYVDDLILGVFILNRVLTDTDAEIVREHWSADGDVLVMVRRVLEAADSLVSPRVLAKIKRILK
ncbi:MAG: YkvA family protein [Thermoanaerobaculia bacterium]